MTVINYLAALLALAALGYEAWMLFKRNRRVIVKGKDDFVTFCLVLLFASLFFRPDINAPAIVSLRNTLILTVIFFTLAIRRGIAEEGILKLGFVIPWDKVKELKLTRYQTSKIQAFILTERGNYKLFFQNYQLKKLVFELQKHIATVYVDDELEAELKKK